MFLLILEYIKNTIIKVGNSIIKPHTRTVALPKINMGSLMKKISTMSRKAIIWALFASSIPAASWVFAFSQDI